MSKHILVIQMQTSTGSILHVLPLGHKDSFVILYNRYSSFCLCSNCLVLASKLKAVWWYRLLPNAPFVTLACLANISSNTTSYRPTALFLSVSKMVPPTVGDESVGKKLALAKGPQIPNDDLKTLTPNPRPRRLTPPLPDNKHRKPHGWRLSLSKLSNRRGQQSTFQQTQSPLFKCLPTEVRLLIWEHYLCSRMLHIVRPNQHKWKRLQKQIVGILCSEPRNFCPCSHHCWGPLARRPVGNCNYGSYYHENSEWRFETRRVNFVPLLQTCRRV